MKNNPVAGLNRLIDRGRSLFVEGMDVRTPEAGIEWQGRADQFEEEAKAWIKEQSPDDAVRLETLSPYPSVYLPLGNPWWKPTSALGLASCTSSVLCEENNPVSYHLALVNELKEIVGDWRVNLPELPIVTARRGRPRHDKPFKDRCDDWAYKMLKHSGRRTYADMADEIAASEEGIKPDTVLRGARESRARKAREGRGKAG